MLIVQFDKKYLAWGRLLLKSLNNSQLSVQILFSTVNLSARDIKKLYRINNNVIIENHNINLPKKELRKHMAIRKAYVLRDAIKKYDSSYYILIDADVIIRNSLSKLIERADKFDVGIVFRDGKWEGKIYDHLKVASGLIFIKKNGIGLVNKWIEIMEYDSVIGTIKKDAWFWDQVSLWKATQSFKDLIYFSIDENYYLDNDFNSSSAIWSANVKDKPTAYKIFTNEIKKIGRISVIITVYNRANLLRKCLISLLHQSVQPDEIIISDDGSSEDILEEISGIVSNFKIPIKFIKQEHNGFRLAKCRNNGVKISSGNLLIFLDQDIICTKDLLKTFINNRKENRFLTGYPIRLTKVQSEKISEKLINDFCYMEIITESQKHKIKKQFMKDFLSFLGLKLKLVKQKPKLRGGVCAINRQDYYLVNGYDEKFEGWGNEDDNIRKRLYKSGTSGFNPFFNQFPLHLYHEPFHKSGNRVNEEYSRKSAAQINNGEFYCQKGIDSLQEENLEIIKVN